MMKSCEKIDLFDSIDSAPPLWILGRVLAEPDASYAGLLEFFFFSKFFFTLEFPLF